jgi:hypothetical protein
MLLVVAVSRNVFLPFTLLNIINLLHLSFFNVKRPFSITSREVKAGPLEQPEKVAPESRAV